MATHYTAYIYRIDSPGGTTQIKAAGGLQNSFPSASSRFYENVSVEGQAQVTCNAIIEVLPTGLVQPPTKYYTAKTVAELQTLANA